MYHRITISLEQNMHNYRQPLDIFSVKHSLHALCPQAGYFCISIVSYAKNHISSAHKRIIRAVLEITQYKLASDSDMTFESNRSQI